MNAAFAKRMVTEKAVEQFALRVVETRALTRRALEDDEVMAELASRGIDRRDIEQLAETTEDVVQGFYNDPVPA